MFFTADMFFYPLDMENQRVRFVYSLKVLHIQETKLPVAITN